MKFRYTILYVEDVPASLAFYEKALGVKIAMLHESGDYGELDTGETKLSFSSLGLMNQLGKQAVKPDAAHPSFEIAFETENVQKALDQAIAAGAELVQPVESMPWGQEIAYIRDINGFLVEICTAVQGE